jgi:hypothetical protein
VQANAIAVWDAFQKLASMLIAMTLAETGGFFKRKSQLSANWRIKISHILTKYMRSLFSKLQNLELALSFDR